MNPIDIGFTGKFPYPEAYHMSLAKSCWIWVDNEPSRAYFTSDEASVGPDRLPSPAQKRMMKPAPCVHCP